MTPEEKLFGRLATGAMGLQMCEEETAFKLWMKPFEAKELEMEDSPLSHYRHRAEDIVRALRFILNYVEDHGISLRGIHLGRGPFEDLSTRKLPISHNKATVWGFYKAAAEKLGERVVDLHNFKQMWKYFLPQVVNKEPTTALCLFCHGNKQLLVMFQLPDELQSVIGDERLQHIENVKKERSFFHKMNAKCGMICEDSHLSLLGPSSPASRKITMCYTFDYAQQVHYPSNPQQPGPMYFLIPRKCGLFGVCCGGMPKQVSYLIDEGMLIREPTNFINYLHHFFNNYGVGETYVDLHSSEGNRHDMLLWYCAWRTMHSLHLKLDLHFRITGHDMSGPDLLFGLFKQVFRKTRVQTLSDIAGVVRDSTPKKQLNIPQLVGLEDGTVLVETYDWDKHLSHYFRRYNNIDRYRHYSFDAKRPGVMMVKEHYDGEETEFQLLLNPDARPPLDGLRVKPPPGMNLWRQKYLFDNIREFCSNETKNIVCPRPKFRI